MTPKKRKNKKVIFARNSFPYKGGSSTILYLLYETIQKNLPDAEFWNIITKRDKEIGENHYGPFWDNPKGLGNVKTFILEGGKRKLRKALKKTKPDIILSKSRISTKVLKKMYKGADLWHLTSTCGVIKNSIARNHCSCMQDAIKKLRAKEITRSYSSEEYIAVRFADKILFHSETMKLWYYNLYPEFIEKMEHEIFWDYNILRKHITTPRDSAKKWARRPIDMLFVASSWNRAEKNFKLLKSLCHYFKDKTITVIGFLPESLPEEIIRFDTMIHSDVIQTMKNTKVIVSPSKYDEAPNILFEGAMNGCNIVCSKNCGNYKIVPKELIAKLDRIDFIKKVKRGLREKTELNSEYFTKEDLGEWILEQVT